MVVVGRGRGVESYHRTTWIELLEVTVKRARHRDLIPHPLAETKTVLAT